MIRTLAIIAGAGLALSIVSFGAAAAIGGHELRSEGGWNVDDWNWEVRTDENGEVTRVRTTRGETADATSERTLPWTGGDSLAVDLAADVVYVQGAEAGVTVSGRQSLVDAVTLTDGRLSMTETTGWRSIDGDDLTITVTAPDVRRFTLAGSGDLSIRDYDRDTLEVAISGSGDVDAAGRARTVTASVDGSGHADLEYVEATDADARVSGSGDVDLAASGAVTANVSGSGDVTLHARPASLTSQVNGSGEVRTEY